MRQRQRFETLDGELKNLKLRYKNLSSRHENLRVLYLDLLRQRGMERGDAVGQKLVPVWEGKAKNRKSPDEGTGDVEAFDEVSNRLFL